MKNTGKIKIGFLPLYIKLYDDIGNGAKARPRLEAFYEKLAGLLEAEDFEVLRSPICRIAPEFETAVKGFEAAGAECIVTWHAAYSPSLECVKALTGTKLPIVVLDTTETYDFGSLQDPGEISYCHGIHGVMDMCNLLKRNGKAYAIAAGHISDSDVIARTAGFVRAAAAAHSMNGRRVGSMGGSFDGMGDFLVTDAEMAEKFGVTVVYSEKKEIESILKEVRDADVRAEMEADKAAYYEIEPVDGETHARTARNCLAVRHWLEKNGLDSFTANFREICPGTGLEIMPFMEACKALSRGVGYAGEGDVLTAVLVGALLRGFKDSTFVEIFCPDWKNNTLLLSHMGEYNPNLVASKPGMKKINFIFGDAADPVVSYGRYRAGKATFLNLYRDEKGFRMLISPVTMVDVKDADDRFEVKVRGWLKPDMPVADFLEEISRHGATHHSALVYGATPEQIAFFASVLGLEYDII